MTAIERYEEPKPRAWVGLFPVAAELAKSIANTDFVPGGLRNNIPATTAAILYGDEVGLGPMQSLSKVAVINGRPTLAAESQRALILAAGHDLWLEEITNTRVTWAGKRRGSENITRITWTMDDAQKAGLAGGNQYRKYPRAMLSARASADLARAVFPDVIGGLGAIEEFDPDYEPSGAPEVSDPTGAAPAPAPAKRTRKPRAPKATVTPPPVAQVTDQAPPEAARPPLPGEAGFGEPEPEKGATLPFPDWYAMKLGELGGTDEARHRLTWALSGGRTEKSAELNGEQTAKARELIDAGPEAIDAFLDAWDQAHPDAPDDSQDPGPDTAPEETDPGEGPTAPVPGTDDEPADADVVIETTDQLRELVKAAGVRVTDVIRKAGEGKAPADAPKSLDDIIVDDVVLETVIAWLDEVTPS